MATVLITGGSGLVGTHLTQRLQRDGHTVRHLSRTAGERNGVTSFAWDIERGQVDGRALEGTDHVVHLSGAGIADKRWTKARMHELRASRIDAAQLLLAEARAAGIRPRSFVSASGIGYYGAVTGEHVFTEHDPAGKDAIGTLARDWEHAVEDWNEISRVVMLRTSTVLAREGGALPVFARLARWGVLAPIGTGAQWMPWVHVNDLVDVYAQAIFDERMLGPYNVAASVQPTSRVLMQAIARTLRKPFFLPNVPAFALRAVYGELAQVLLAGSRVSTRKLSELGIALRFERPEDALKDLLR
jgi:uncharacterized protein (TIGR01777 family)